MGDVIPVDFGRPRKRLGGLIPDEIGQMALEEAERDRRARLYSFAKTGEPVIVARPEDFGPGDCA